MIKEMAGQKEAYEKVSDAFEAVQVKGYGVVSPGLSDIKMEEPVLIRHGNKFGVKMKAVYVFMGRDGMSAGPGLMFISLPKVFNEMGIAGDIVGLIFFMIVAFAAVTSSVSIMEAIVSSLIDRFHWSRRKSAILVTVYALIAEIIVCLGYNKLYMEVKLPNGTVGQILDIMDYVSNNVLMPIVALATCILVGWIVSPKVIIDEVTRGGSKFTRKGLYIIMVKFIAPVFLLILLLQALGIVTF